MRQNVIEYSSSKEKQGETIMNMADIAPPGLSYNYPLDSIEIMYGCEGSYYLTTFDTFVEKITQSVHRLVLILETLQQKTVG